MSKSELGAPLRSSRFAVRFEQALDSEAIRLRLQDVLPGPGRLVEALRELAGSGRGHV